MGTVAVVCCQSIMLAQALGRGCKADGRFGRRRGLVKHYAHPQRHLTGDERAERSEYAGKVGKAKGTSGANSSPQRMRLGSHVYYDAIPMPVSTPHGTFRMRGARAGQRGLTETSPPQAAAF